MTLAQSLLPELDHEMAGTRRTLERVPGDRLGWRPHPKSKPLGELAAHLATIPSLVKPIATQDSLDVQAHERHYERLTSPETMLGEFDAHLAEARSLIASAADDRLLAPWTLISGGRNVFTFPRIAVLRTMVLSHTIHHRAQLGVYLRLLDVPVPGLYGPSADETF